MTEEEAREQGGLTVLDLKKIKKIVDLCDRNCELGSNL